jgi:hypothetical protein
MTRIKQNRPPEGKTFGNAMNPIKMTLHKKILPVDANFVLSQS